MEFVNRVVSFIYIFDIFIRDFLIFNISSQERKMINKTITIDITVLQQHYDINVQIYISILYFRNLCTTVFRCEHRRFIYPFQLFHLYLLFYLHHSKKNCFLHAIVDSVNLEKLHFKEIWNTELCTN